MALETKMKSSGVSISLKLNTTVRNVILHSEDCIVSVTA